MTLTLEESYLLAAERVSDGSLIRRISGPGGHVTYYEVVATFRKEYTLRLVVERMNRPE